MGGLGFTGTQYGMSRPQIERVTLLLQTLEPTEVHHGLCIGADAQFHNLVRQYLPQAKIIGHPPIKHDKRCVSAIVDDCDELREPKDYLDRDLDIVLETDKLLAAPHSKTEVIRSGTWYTVRQARKAFKRYYLVFPDGTYQNHR